VHGQEVKAIVVVDAAAEVGVDDLARFAAETLSSFKVPTQWDLRTEPLPRNASGKVLKTVLLGETDAPSDDH
jgi:acyl-coenzyme A synthetase/AMP-(fatty) acid ligase